MNRQKSVHLILFILGFAMATLWQGIKSQFSFRPVQSLASRDRSHLAVLERVDSLDLNFRIKLDGREIYRSADFNPDPSLPFRETLLWDVTGNSLIFEVVGRRFFGYDIKQQRALSSAELLGAKVNTVSMNEAGFEGRWPHTR